MSASYCVGIPLPEWRIKTKDLENPKDSGVYAVRKLSDVDHAYLFLQLPHKD